jgi:DNA-directed RNA polymerase specialized sigma24 family protein
MTNVAAPVLPDASALADLVRAHLDDLVTYATHLVGDVDDAVEFVAGGIFHASRYPPARLQSDGRVALYRAVTRACRQEQRFPPRPHGPARFFRRGRAPFHAEVESGSGARINTVKRALMTVTFDRRAALLLRDLSGLSYREIGTALECSPDAAARLLAAARREFGTVYREIAI